MYRDESIYFYLFKASPVQGEVPSTCEAEGLSQQTHLMRTPFSLEYNPSVTASPCQLPLHRGAKYVLLISK